ncbi:unnamed protein product [Caenorhabditis auriculariae]|uniref:Transcriptional repressor p66 coiled-coil MBD2-interaction domain-containing protein n=1 Tax=Caenorhabditis auriculariae TaxID=2777116 RepID=A0A8S1GN28_9PELO|nr:unnamed protein product [Caenorhabditis auriculariae]
MAQIDQVSTASLNGLGESNGTNGSHSLPIEPMDLSSISNGSPAKVGYANASSSGVDNESLQLSPASLRRRSTRASALKAQEKIKLKDENGQEHVQNGGEEEEKDEEMPAEDGVPVAKKRKLENGGNMDQFSHRFGIRIDDDDVYALTDESEVSSLHNSEVEVIRGHLEKYLSKELSEEQKNERLIMIKQCEAALRQEEAQLTMLKKVKSSQTLAAQKAAELKKLTANLPPSNSSGTAYKPIVAPPLNKPASSNAQNANNNTKQNAARNPLLALSGLTPQQQQELLSRLVASKAGGTTNQQQAALIAQMIAHINQQQLAQKEQQQVKDHPTVSASTAGNSLGLTQLQSKALAAQTPQQRSAAARAAFRSQADKQLVLLNGPKAPGPEIFFIPNANQPDFVPLLGLDLVVQRVLKDKNVMRPVTEPCYVCEECGTDFTTAWKAIGTHPDELHLYCEACVRSAQKRKIRNDHTGLLKKAFAKICSQEKEFEKQLAEGKLDDALAAAAASQQSQAARAHNNSLPSTSSPLPTQHRTSSVSTPTNVATTSNSNTPASSKMPQLKQMSSAPSKSSTPTNSKKNNSAASNAMSAQMQQIILQQFLQGPMRQQANFPALQQHMMQMWANPTLAAAAMNAQRMQNPNMAAMMAIMQAAQQSNSQNSSAQAQVQQQQQQQQMAALVAMMGGNAAMMNPHMMRALQQQMTSAHQRNADALKSKK